MKNTFLLAALLTLIAGAAQAAPLSCTTNVDRDPRKASTDVTVDNNDDETVAVTVQTRGGMAHFITAPEKFLATFQAIGPEVVVYQNAEHAFKLTVNYQSLSGKIHGSLEAKVLGKKITTPVLCVKALN
ncbi:MAG: hypothetical protein ACXWQO_02850 [Bdellovibrionota bacterium]